MPRVDLEKLSRWRAMDAKLVLKAFSDHAKLDVTFVPLKDKSTSRWHVNAKGREFELLLTGSKFFDTRAEKGAWRGS